MIERCLIGKKIEQGKKWFYFEKFDLLTTEERRNATSLKFIYRHVINNTNFSKSASRLFTKRPDQQRSSRCSLNLVVPNYKKTFAQSSFVYNSVQLWNYLPLSVKKTENFIVFDNSVRQIITKKRKDYYKC
jgi:hypothetical protein